MSSEGRSEWPHRTDSSSGSRTARRSSATAAWARSSRAPSRACAPEEANLRAPDAVVSLHVGFIRAGAELIETNTFGANRRKLAATTSRTSSSRSTRPASASRARHAR